MCIPTSNCCLGKDKGTNGETKTRLSDISGGVHDPLDGGGELIGLTELSHDELDLKPMLFLMMGMGEKRMIHSVLYSE